MEMGIEMLVALVALFFGFMAFARSRSASKELEATLQAARQELEAIREQLQGVSGLRERFPSEAPGPRSTSRQTHSAGELGGAVEELKERLRDHDELLCSLITEDEARHLWNVSRGVPIVYDSHPGVQAELRSLVRRGLLEKRGEFKIHELPGGFDLVEHFVLSRAGEKLLSSRKHLEESDVAAGQISIPPRAEAS